MFKRKERLIMYWMEKKRGRRYWRKRRNQSDFTIISHHFIEVTQPRKTYFQMRNIYIWLFRWHILASGFLLC